MIDYNEIREESEAHMFNHLMPERNLIADIKL